MTAKHRNRVWLAGATALVILLGLGSRAFPAAVPDPIGAYAGDACWALMVYLIVAWLRPGATPPAIGLTALAIAFAVEFLQLYQAAWIEAVRGTLPGHLVLGADFDGRDLIALGCGVAVGYLVDWIRWRP